MVSVNAFFKFLAYYELCLSINQNLINCPNRKWRMVDLARFTLQVICKLPEQFTGN